MRLIDAEQCPCEHCKQCMYIHVRHCLSYERWVNKTAYDVEKIVNDLEYASYCRSTPTFDHPYTDSIIDLNEAIDIVKRGGINEAN